jgi:hypothetical protein
MLLNGRTYIFEFLLTVLGIRIRKILGLLDPDPDPLVRGTDLDLAPDSSIIKQKK